MALRTSGTTGAPRSVVRSPDSWVRSFPHVAELTGLAGGSRLWLPGPLAATLNLFAATMARHLGIRLVETVAEASHAHLTPMQLQRLLDDGLALGGLHVTVAGDRLSAALRDRALAAGAEVTHYYGTAELSFVAWGGDEDDLRPFPEVEVEVRDGEIWARSPYLCEGYVGPPGPLRRDADGFATVADRGTYTDGRLVVHGRGDDAVVTGGATVLVGDVEDALRAGLQGTVVVVGVPHVSLGQVVGAVLSHPQDLPAAHAAAQQRLAPVQRPRQWFHLPEPPLTAAGKVDRAAVASEVAGPDAVRMVPRRPRTLPRAVPR